MNSRLKFTLKAWPAVFLIAVTLSFGTQGVAKLFGIDLPDQAQVELVKRYAGWNLTFAFIVAQVVIIVPVFEEVLFRFLLWKVPLAVAGKWRGAAAVPRIVLAAIVSVVFSFAHYVDYAKVASTHALAFTGWNSAFLALFFVGVAQCWIYRRTGALWCAMLNHMLFNVTNLVLLFILPE